MKNVKFLLAAAFALFSAATIAQDFSAPQYAKWGETPELREKHILASNFLKESYENHDFNAASHYLKVLLDGCPDASLSIYQRGALVFKNKINRAKSLDEKTQYVDSLLLLYDLRNQYFGDGGDATAKILDLKARETLTYKPSDRPAIREAFRKAIEVGGDNSDPQSVTVYFANLIEDYKNTDQVTPDEVIAEYERLSSFFAANPKAEEAKNQFDAAFGLSGVASCENLEKLFAAKLAAKPNDENILAQAVSLMSRAQCETDYFFELSEKYYLVKPSSETALFLAQAFQNKNDYDKATKYISEALATEKNPSERAKLLIRMSLIELVTNDILDAASCARQARDLEPENGVPYFLLAQCYAASAGNCGGFAAQTAMWVAYDTMSQAISLLASDSEYMANARASLSGYRSRFPSSEEIFFNELKEGSRFTVNCGIVSGVTTTVRAR